MDLIEETFLAVDPDVVSAAIRGRWVKDRLEAGRKPGEPAVGAA
ncbi:hypothetical protein GCM10020369_79530 [Cryptosporangium minutisporangium]|uniref:Uncharacterized protein n=1 Tax=Cryptosporangium minutisporangium TaxID=113569 RepID=A0ABP6TAX4_9ACTN